MHFRLVCLVYVRLMCAKFSSSNTDEIVRCTMKTYKLSSIYIRAFKQSQKNAQNYIFILSTRYEIYVGSSFLHESHQYSQIFDAACRKSPWISRRRESFSRLKWKMAWSNDSNELRVAHHHRTRHRVAVSYNTYPLPMFLAVDFSSFQPTQAKRVTTSRKGEKYIWR